jgi:hypothetical protein
VNQGIAGGIAAVMPAVLECGLMTSLCTITVPPHIFGPSGAPDPTAAYTVLPGHQDIPCTAPPLSIGETVQPTEIKEIAEIYAKNMLHVLLGGYYPQIIADYRAIINGIEYDIVGVESDSQKQMTRLAVQVVTV